MSSRSKHDKKQLQGEVLMFSSERGFGFIKPDGEDTKLYVHHSQIRSDEAFKTLVQGQRVSFTRAPGYKFGEQAEDVRVVGVGAGRDMPPKSP